MSQLRRHSVRRARKFWGFWSDPGSSFHFKIYIFESQNIVWRRLRRLELPDAPYFPFRARYTLFPLQSQEHQIFLHLEPGTQTTPPPGGGSNFNPQNFWDWRPMCDMFPNLLWQSKSAYLYFCNSLCKYAWCGLGLYGIVIRIVIYCF